MGRSRKDSRRRITVDGVVYHYRVVGDDGFAALIARPEGSQGLILPTESGQRESGVDSN